MVISCVAYGCKNIQFSGNGIQFHSFPFKRPEVLKLWMEAIKRENWKPSKTSRICSQHFKDTNYQDLRQRKMIVNKESYIIFVPPN
ncbi:hypothetical protein Trydic_g10928 [Trypoxylus dichotomus]